MGTVISELNDGVISILNFDFNGNESFRLVNKTVCKWEHAAGACGVGEGCLVAFKTHKIVCAFSTAFNFISTGRTASCGLVIEVAIDTDRTFVSV